MKKSSIDLYKNLQIITFQEQLPILKSKNIIYSVLASLICVMGYLNNSLAPIIGSMIISPILAPFQKYVAIQKTSSRDNISLMPILMETGMLIAIIFTIGLIIGIINHSTGYFKKETFEMESPYKNNTYHTEFIIASIVGVTLAYSIIRGESIVKVGLAITMPILPFIILTGLYSSNAIVALIRGDHKDSKEQSKKMVKICLLWIINIIMVCITLWYGIDLFMSFV